MYDLLKKHTNCSEGICSTEPSKAHKTWPPMNSWKVCSHTSYKRKAWGKSWACGCIWRSGERGHIHLEQQMCWVVSWLQPHQENRRLISKAMWGSHEIDLCCLISTNLTKQNPARPKSVLAHISYTSTACPWPTDAACSGSPLPTFLPLRNFQGCQTNIFPLKGWGVNRVLAHTATTSSAVPCSEPALPVPFSHHCHTTWHRHTGRTVGGKPTHFFWAADKDRLLYALTVKVKQGAKEAGKEGSYIKLSVSKINLSSPPLPPGLTYPALNIPLPTPSTESCLSGSGSKCRLCASTRLSSEGLLPEWPEGNTTWCHISTGPKHKFCGTHLREVQQPSHGAPSVTPVKQHEMLSGA